MFKKLIFIIIAIVVIAFIGYNYIYQDHRDIAKEEAEYVLSANELVEAFKENLQTAENKYLNKTIVVKGNVTSLNPNNLILNKSIFCGFVSVPENIKPNEEIVVKGRCIGFDGLLGEVKLDQCSLDKQI